MIHITSLQFLTILKCLQLFANETEMSINLHLFIWCCGAMLLFRNAYKRRLWVQIHLLTATTRSIKSIGILHYPCSKQLGLKTLATPFTLSLRTPSKEILFPGLLNLFCSNSWQNFIILLENFSCFIKSNHCFIISFFSNYGCFKSRTLPFHGR